MIFPILAASGALDGTLAPYRPPTFREWLPGAWARDTWGPNDEFEAGSGGGGAPGAASALLTRRRRRIVVG